MTDMTPVTDDDRRNAHKWAADSRGQGDPGSYLDCAVRFILDTVPAPPKSLADELRTVADIIGSDFDSEAQRLDTLADRVEAEKKEHDALFAGALQDRDTAVRLRNSAYQKRDEARDEVERLTAIEAEHERLYGACEEDQSPVTFTFDAPNPSTLTNPADVPKGELWEVTVGDLPAAGYRDSTECYPWSVIFADDEGTNDDYTDDAITLVSRLVRETRRVIDRPEDLDALPVGSIVIDKNGNPWKKLHDGLLEGIVMVTNSEGVLNRVGPVTVIYEPMIDSCGHSGSDS